MQSLPSSPPSEADKLAKCGKKKFRHRITNSEQKHFFSAIHPVTLGRTGTVTKKTCILQEDTERNVGMGRVCCFEGSLLQLLSLTSLYLWPPLFPFCDLSFPQFRVLSLPSPPSPSRPANVNISQHTLDCCKTQKAYKASTISNSSYVNKRPSPILSDSWSRTVHHSPPS